MKRSGTVTLVLITAALASCNRYLTPAETSTPDTAGPGKTDSTFIENVYEDPVYAPWCNGLLSQWIYAFNPYACNYYYYGPPRIWRRGRFYHGHRLSQALRSAIVRGGWGRSAHTTVNS